MTDYIDYYKLLGVPHDASESEIRKAFQKKALENHPDRISHLPEDEKKQRQENMYTMSEAYGVLTDPDKRRTYDILGRVPIEGESASPKTRDYSDRSSYKDLFDNFLKSGVFGDYFGTSNNQNSRSTKKEKYNITIPENDWGLLAALKTAYGSKTDGKWRVRKTQDDDRDWVPDEIYSVKRKNGEIRIYRRITDWRPKANKDNGIFALKDINKPEKKRYSPDEFLGEYFLCEEGRNLMEESYCIPTNYNLYISSLKSVARKFVKKEINKDENYDVGPEIDEMNRYGMWGSRNTRKEGQDLWADDSDREWVRKVPQEEFWSRLERAEKLITQVEGVPVPKEGNSKNPHNPSGESMG
jgi:curved DNA-binding protein CbpA